jgi:dihydrofolate reductase
MPRETNDGSVIWQVTMSLDGYIAADGDDMGWIFEYIDPSNPAGAEVPARIGSMIAGRRSFDVGARDGMEVYDGSWSGAQFLMTNRPSADLPDGLRVRSGPVRQVVEEALDAAGGRDVGIIGADIARQALESNLVDEVVVHVAPVLLGDGVRFRGALGRKDLRLVDTARHGEVVTAHYRVPHGQRAEP